MVGGPVDSLLQMSIAELHLQNSSKFSPYCVAISVLGVWGGGREGERGRDGGKGNELHLTTTTFPPFMWIGGGEWNKGMKGREGWRETETGLLC